jgi:CheY-like chemotaxis protein
MPLPEVLKKASVLVVDDKPEVAAYIARQIRPHCNKVRVVTPDRAVGVIRRNRVDLLVTDLRMPNTSVRSAIGLLKQLGARAPATVAMTGSLSAQHLDRLRARSITEMGVPVFRTFLKGDNVSAVVGELGAALEDARVTTTAERCRVISSLSDEVPFGTEEIIANQRAIVHEISQDLKVFVSTMSRGLRILRQRFALETWPSWKEQGSSIEGQLNALRGYTTDTFLGSIGQTCDALHNIRPMAMLCDTGRLSCPDSFSPLKRRRVVAVIDHLSAAQMKFSGTVNQAYKAAEEIVRGEITFADLTKKLPPRSLTKEIYSADGARGGETLKIPDPQGKLRAFFTELGKILEADEFPYLEIRYYSPQHVIKDGGHLRDTLGWGSWYTIFVTISKGYEERKPSWAYLESLASHFAGGKDRIHVLPNEFLADEPADSLCFDIRASLVDKEALQVEQKRLNAIKILDTATFEANREDVVATTVEIAGRRCVLIDDGGFDPKSPLRGDFSLQIVDGTCIFAGNSLGHTFADARIYFYLREKMSKNRSEALEIARESIRGKLVGNKEFALKIEPGHDDELKEYGIPDIMAALGYPKMGQVHFAPRTLLARNCIYGDRPEV